MGVVRSTDRQAGESNFSGIAGKVLLDPDAGAGAVTLGELVIEPGAELPLHKHLVEEAFFILKAREWRLSAKARFRFRRATPFWRRPPFITDSETPPIRNSRWLSSIPR